MNISYRILVSDDSAQYRAIRLASLKAHPESFGSSYEEQRGLPKLMFERALEQPVDGRFVMGAFDQRELVGICGFIPFALEVQRQLIKTGTLIQLYLSSPYRGRGMGLKLVAATIREAFKLPNIEHIILGVKADNTSAIRVYRGAGFYSYNSGGDHAAPDDDRLYKMIIHRDR